MSPSIHRIILRRGPNGFGFVIQTIRVYFGDSDFYTMHHLVMSVNETSPGEPLISFDS
jgi:microtubule-associated serine/threonine kinase